MKRARKGSVNNRIKPLNKFMHGGFSGPEVYYR